MSQPIAILSGDFGRVGLVRMDAPIALHLHHHCHFILKTDGADTQFNINGCQYAMTEETAIFVNAWQPHQWAPSHAIGETSFLTFYIEPSWLAKVLNFKEPNVALPYTRHPRVRINNGTLTKVRALKKLMECLSSGEEGDACQLINEIALELAEQYWRNSSLACVQKQVVDFRIRKALEQLRMPENFDRVEQIPVRVGLSRSHFFKLFRESTGFSPTMFVNARRMEYAIKGLIMDESSFIDLAYDLGFSAPGNFSRFFRQQIGLTPRDYQKAVLSL